MSPQTVRVNRLTAETWIGPITVLSDEVAVPSWQYAFTDTDWSTDDAAFWQAPVGHPDGAVAGLGVLVGTGTGNPLVLGSYLLVARPLIVLDAPVMVVAEVTVTAGS